MAWQGGLNNEKGTPNPVRHVPDGRTGDIGVLRPKVRFWR